MITLLFASLLMVQAGSQSSRYPATETEKIQQTLQFSGAANHMIELDNVSGSIHVASTTGRSVEMTANKTIRAESQQRILDAKRDVKLDITDNAETIRIYVDGPFRCTCADGRDGWRSSGARWSEPGYRVDIDFDLRVPDGTKLRLRTVNGGEISVDRTTGDFEVENVNGRITMTDIRGSGSAQTVNGAVNVSFLENPKSTSGFKTVNGAIEVAFQPDLSADLQMKTFNGGLYTDFDVKSLPASAVKAERVNGMFVYRGNSFSGFRVGNGGPEIKFDGFNGDVRVVRRTR
jgi:DUF4097 and DUF4098 domain-containing protein YvlB